VPGAVVRFWRTVADVARARGFGERARHGSPEPTPLAAIAIFDYFPWSLTSLLVGVVKRGKRMPDWLGTILSVILGSALTMASNWLADRRLSDQGREHRREERRERLTIRRKDFQRETLLALQIASQNLLRNTGAALHQDMLAHRNGGEWQRQKLPDNLSDDDLRLRTDTMLLASRVRDDSVRSLADRLRSQTADVGFPKTNRRLKVECPKRLRRRAS
jgi:hypothetical protein